MPSVMKNVVIDGRAIGRGEPPFLVAEISANHLGRIDRALSLIEASAEAGADAVKLQTYTADTITIDHDGPEFVLKGGLWGGRKLFDLYDEAHTPWEWHRALFDKAHACGMTAFSSPFDASAVEFLETLNVPAYKIASFEIVDLPLIKCCAATGKPLVISTGMASRDEIECAVNIALKYGSGQVILLHCTSGYPTPLPEADLRTIPDLAATFDLPVGLSDHTNGFAVPVAAVALGAVMVEKHITMQRADGGPDASFSLHPDEFAVMVKACGDAYAALGHVRSARAASEEANVAIRRSLYVIADMKPGETFTSSNLRSIRPGLGLPPKHLPEILGRRARHEIKRGTALSWPDIEK